MSNNNKPQINVLRVVSRFEGFRRAGRTFGSKAVDIPLSELKKTEIVALKSDESLVVVEAAIAAPEEATAQTAAK